MEQYFIFRLTDTIIILLFTRIYINKMDYGEYLY